MPKPSPGHEKLQELAGNWEGSEYMHPSAWDPAGGTAVGRRTNRIDLNGFALLIDYQQERDGVTTFAGHGVMTFEPGKDLYVLHWFDCMGNPPEVFTGRFEGPILTLSHGGRMHARLSYDLSDPQQMRSRMEMSSDGSRWDALFEGSYRRS